ncbi:MAG: acyl-CoA thioesterase [Saprospiraceae bacterium]|nr:acyl-CoA thioesterase [Saprospiraceae bacterium]
MEAKKVSESKTIMTEMVMPPDTNTFGNLMGGILMKWMDVAGAICAGRHAENYVVTASVDNVSFEHPIRLGDIITLEAVVTRAFNTSIEVFIEVFIHDIVHKKNTKSNHAYFTFVALEPTSMRPTKVPEVLPITEQEENLYTGAVRRREIRLVLSGRMKPSEAIKVKEFLDLHQKK